MDFAVTIQLDRALVLLNGFVVLPHVFKAQAETVVRLHESRVERDRFFELGCCV
jgi:hypothetical protein